jgi:DNA-binding GntR family transcriptional regulator
MGVARNTVREGIRRLEAEGLVHHRIHRGAVVATLEPSDIAEIFEVRRFVEFSALRRCASEDIRNLTSVAEEMVALVPTGDPERLVEADMRFHQTLVDSLGNSRLSAYFANTLAELRIALCLAETGDASVWAPLHLRLCRLLAADDREAAVELLGGHFDETQTVLVETLAGAPV